MMGGASCGRGVFMLYLTTNVHVCVCVCCVCVVCVLCVC